MQSLPVLFEENDGQFGENTKFRARGKGFNVLLNSDEIVFQMPDANCERRNPKTKNRILKSCGNLSLTMKMLGADTNAAANGIDQAATKTSYLIGSDQSRWRANINNYQAVRYEKIYQGVDVIFRGAAQNLEYDFHIAPEADPNSIQLEFGAVKKVKIDRSGNLIFRFRNGELRHQKPFAYQIVNGERREVSAKFISLGKNKIGFAVGEYDQANELIIDPIISQSSPDDPLKYATYLGGSRQDSTEDIAIDSAGYIYLASDAQSEDFLGVPGFVDTGFGRFSDVYVTKLNPEGTQIIYNTVVGGAYDDIPWAIGVDDFGNAYVGGQTSSSDFPMVNARQTSNSLLSQYDVEGFVFKLDSSGSSLSYSTYHGATSHRNGYDTDWVNSISVDASGNLYAVGSTGGIDFPLTNGFQTARTRGIFDAYLSKFSPSGQLLYSTLYGSDVAGTYVIGKDVAVDNRGFAYLSGEVSYNSQLPLSAGAYETGGNDGFVAKFDTNKTGSASLAYATYTESIGDAIAIDSEGNAVTIGSGGRRYIGSIVKLNNTGTGANFKFAVQGRVNDAAINGEGNIYFIEDIYPAENQNDYDVRVTGYSPTGTLIGKTIIKGAAFDQATGIALDSDKNIYVVGHTGSLNFPTTADALQLRSRYVIRGGSSQQGFLAKVRFDPLPRNPLIFIPGTMGSDLYRKEMNVKYWARWGNGFLYNSYLTLDSQSSDFLGNDAFEARDVFREVRYEGSIPIVLPYLTGQIPFSINPFSLLPTVYDDLLKKLTATDKDGGHYIEYHIRQNPTLRNADGTCDLSQMNNPEGKPNLFVFPYDFRKSNAESAVKLKQFIECVQAFYPDDKVDILGHSQGGIVARRYILDSVRTGQDSKVDKLITLASPWLGAPEAIYKMETGGDYLPDGFEGGLINQLGFSIGLITPSTVKTLAEFFPSVHQLLPTKDYNNLAGASLKESGDMNGDGISNQSYSYEQTKLFLNNDFPRSLPGNNSAEFHDYSGQDDWRNDQSGVKYYHIAATKIGATTTTAVNVKNENACIATEQTVTCRAYRNFYPTKGLGDGTVPRLSADKGYINESNRGLNAPDATVVHLDSPSISENANYEHNGITKNPFAYAYILSWLGVSSNSAANSFSAESVSNKSLSNETRSLSQPDNAVSGEENYYIKILGVSEVEISDGDGNRLIRNNEYTVNPVNGLLEYKVIGDNALFLTFEPTKTHYIDFQVGGNPLMIEALKGVDNQTPDLAVRYKDVSLPAGVRARLTLTAQGVESLQYDSNGDGSFDRVVNPTVVLNGTNANDVEPPTAAIDFTQHGTSVALTVTGQDALSGIGKIRYSLDGIHFSEYTSPVNLNYTPNTIKVFAFADDNAANRSGLYTKEFKFTDVTPPTTSAVYELNAPQATVTLSSTDNLSGVESISYAVDGGALQIYSNPFTVSGSGNHTVAYFAKDLAGNVETQKSLTFTIPAINPVVTISSPSAGSVFPVGTPVNFTGSFSNDQCNTHTAVWTFNNVSRTGTVNETSRAVIANYTFTSAGIYLVSLTVNNGCGGTGTANTINNLMAMIVVYDPDGGFVTAGGWIDSPLGAYKANQNLTGKANFNFNPKYKKGATVPTGNVEFQMQAANFNFKSTSFDWLVIAGAKAQLKGAGTINGSGNYAFIVTAIDGKIDGSGADKFRIKIWDKATSNVVYDNQLGGSDGENPTTVIGGGSITIHK